VRPILALARRGDACDARVLGQERGDSGLGKVLEVRVPLQSVHGGTGATRDVQDATAAVDQQQLDLVPHRALSPGLQGVGERGIPVGIEVLARGLTRISDGRVAASRALNGAAKALEHTPERWRTELLEELALHGSLHET